MRAILSDIHGNLEALDAVLEDVARHAVQEVYCLGDVIGYGPDPAACLDRMMNCKLALLGNHDQAALFDPVGFNEVAEAAIYWTREQLEAPVPNRAARDRRWEFLASFPRRHKEGRQLFVHASPRNPINEYVFPEDIYNQRKMECLFALVEHVCYHGHTHLPGLILESGEFLSPEDVGGAHRLDARKALVNVGSVGQPRDGDWRACYVLLDGDEVRFRRVEYNVEATAQKIYAVPELANFLGDRLRLGR
jgi:diadenosine tetraphosphatase ApaH/serine/threonine PP2A family protein phosphatase